jgi:cytochrome d ubiquinol oxidase subunit I
MIGLTLTLYLVLYAVLIVAYVSVLKYMAEKPEDVLQVEAAERRRHRLGVATSPVPAGRERGMDLMSFDAMLPVIFMG